MIVSILLAILVLFVLLTLAWIPYYKWCDTYIKSLKGPPCYPLIGVLYLFRDKSKIYETIMDLHKEYGKSFRGYFLNELNIITSDPELIEFTVTNGLTINKGTAYYYLHNWLGTGLLTSSDNKWHRRRKMITPAYHFKVLDQFVDMFDRNGNIMIKRLQCEVDKSQTDIYPFVNLCALDSICETAMGTSVNAQISTDSEFVKATKEMSRIAMIRGFDFWKAMDWSYAFTEDYQLEKKALKVLHGYTLNLIKTRREELLRKQSNDANCNKESDEAIFGAKRKDNFLDLLLKSTIDGQPLSDEDIREEVDTFTFEGHDTVSSGISFALYLLSNHPDTQSQVLEEQKAIFGNEPNRVTTLADLQDMKYLEMVIKETLRLYPSVPMMVRQVSENLTYRDWKLGPGTQIVIHTYRLHRDPKVFPEPEKFVPERFLPENTLGRNPFSYIPFSAGHRNCIGQKFAMLEMKSTIGKVIRNFELVGLVPKHEPTFFPEIVLRSDNGILMKLRKRNWL